MDLTSTCHIQVCSNFHSARVFIMNTCPDEIPFPWPPPGMQVNLVQDLQTQPLLKSPPTEKKGMVPLTEEVEEERNGVVDDPWGVRHVFPDHFLICERGCQKSTSMWGVAKSQLPWEGLQSTIIISVSQHWTSESYQIVEFETPGLHCKSPSSCELRYKSRNSKKSIQSQSKGRWAQRTGSGRMHSRARWSDTMYLSISFRKWTPKRPSTWYCNL